MSVNFLNRFRVSVLHRGRTNTPVTIGLSNPPIGLLQHFKSVGLNRECSDFKSNAFKRKNLLSRTNSTQHIRRALWTYLVYSFFKRWPKQSVVLTIFGWFPWTSVHCRCSHFAALAPSAPIAFLRFAVLLIRVLRFRWPHVECAHWLRGLRKYRLFFVTSVWISWPAFSRSFGRRHS